MTALIVIFITLSLMGSVLWVLPPKKERERMALRMHARKLGLVVQLTSIDLPDKWDKSMNRHKVVAYSLYRAKPLTVLPDRTWLLPYEVWKYHSLVEGWWSSNQVSLSGESRKTLLEFDDVLKAIKITPEGIFLYWNEQGDEDVLDELAKVIFSLAEINNIN